MKSWRAGSDQISPPTQVGQNLNFVASRGEVDTAQAALQGINGRAGACITKYCASTFPSLAWSKS